MIGRSILLATAMVGALAILGPYLDGVSIDDHGAEVQQARDLEDAQRAAQARARFEKVARYMCGPQSPWREVSNGVIQCMTRAGKPTTKVSVKE